MNQHARITIIMLSWWSLFVVGCQSASDLATDLDAPTSATAAKSFETKAGSKETIPTDAEKQSALEKEDQPYQPPFPLRVDLFAPPRGGEGVVRRDDHAGESVVLHGFVDVEELRAVLKIDGRISPLAEGAESEGVQVISIQPPTVVLQRGRSRWTATLE